jgi:BlaI family penicillinase repressor
MSKQFRLGDLQLRIMQVLWDRGPATVADVLEQLGPQVDLAYTTVATMLRKMEDRGLVTHESQGRKFVYQAAVAAGDVTKSMANDLVDRLFEGSVAGMVNHLLTTREVSQAELDELQKLIEARKQRKKR